MIDTQTYLRFCDEALESMAGIVRELGDDLANRRPGVPGGNTAYAIVTHCLGVLGYWASTVNRGIPVPRDRPAEFTASGPVGELVERVGAARAQFHTDVEAADPSAASASPPAARFPQDAFVATQGGVLLHVYRELAQHLGQLEITRDLVRTRPIGGVPRP